MNITPTPYYDEFKKYFKLAKHQQELTNLGWQDYKGSVDDALMENIELYDVVERKYAGFSAIINDVFYGSSEEHPYHEKMKNGKSHGKRDYTIMHWDEVRKHMGLEEWLYVMLLHRLCGSGINYAHNPSGYHNTILFDLWQAADSIENMAEMVTYYPKTFYTSVGYQFPRFPKPPQGSPYKRGGDYFLAEYAPRLIREFASFLQTGKKTFREMGDWLFKWNTDNGLVQFKFQYAAFIADVADWFPELVHRDSLFYYGSNARECISYLATPNQKMKPDDFLDEVMMMVYKDLDSVPYNAEDVCCDFIRWVENYIQPGSDYDHVCMDTTWSSCEIIDHPKGRQKAMLDLGLVDTFNTFKKHPADTKVIDSHNLTIEEYKDMVSNHYK